jgi:hypothetical protein
MLVDPELAERGRELLREPHEANGKGTHMSAALGTHEITAGMSFGLEPPLSPPVVRGPLASAMPTGDGLAGLPVPPPAIRPPESATPASAPLAEAPQQQPEPAAAPPSAPAQPGPELPAMAPQPEPAAPVHDYFATQSHLPPPEIAPVDQAEAAPEIAPVEQAEAAPEPEIHSVPLMAPAPPPAEEQVVELPAMAPAEEPAPDLAPAAVVAPEPVELVPLAPIMPQAEADNVEHTVVEAEPAPEPAAVELELPVVEPVAQAEFAPAAELEELFGLQHSDFRVVVRLKQGDGVVVGSFRDFGTAMAGAQEVIEQFSTATESQWPFYAGRFIRPDLIVSVDVVEGDGAEI